MVTYQITTAGWIAIGDELANQIFTSIGDDWIWGYGGDDIIGASDGQDAIYSGSGNDIIDAGTGKDIVLGEAGNDTIFASAGDDYVAGGDDADLILGELGNDILLGDAGNDTIHGSSGGDVLIGGHGADMLYGGDGNDWLWGFDQSTDSFSNFPSAYDIDLIDGGAGNDVITAAGKATVFAGIGSDIINISNEATVYAGDGNDWINDTSFYFATYAGGSGNDVYILNDSSFTPKVVFDEAGDDVVIVQTRSGATSTINRFTVTSGPGDDYIDGAWYIAAGSGDDIIIPGNDAWVWDGPGNDSIVETRGNSRLFMEPGIDTVTLRPVIAEVVSVHQCITAFRGVCLEHADLSTTINRSSQIYYDNPEDVAPGNLDIITNFRADAGINDIDETSPGVFADKGPIRDLVFYDDALGRDVHWYDDASGDLFMANSQGIFAKFIDVSADQMNGAFFYY